MLSIKIKICAAWDSWLASVSKTTFTPVTADKWEPFLSAFFLAQRVNSQVQGSCYDAMLAVNEADEGSKGAAVWFSVNAGNTVSVKAATYSPFLRCETFCSYRITLYMPSYFHQDKTLRKIPKIFLFNMCRDSWEGWVPAPDEKSSTVKSDSQSSHFHHSLRDTLLLFSTLPYEVSLRDTYKGAMYITELDRVFGESAGQKMLRKMLYETHMAVLEKYGQTPTLEDIGFQDLKFKPRGK